MTSNGHVHPIVSPILVPIDEQAIRIHSEAIATTSTSSTSSTSSSPPTRLLEANTAFSSIASTSSHTTNQSESYNYSIPIPQYPSVTPHLHTSPIQISASPETGRGLFAATDIKAGTLIEIAPVLVLSNEDYYEHGVDKSILKGYVFTWKGGREKGMALALGLGSLFNHSNQPNVSFQLHPEEYTIHFKTSKNVEAGQELCIFYGHDAHFSSNLSSEAVSEEEAEEDGFGGLGDPDLNLVEIRTDNGSLAKRNVINHHSPRSAVLKSAKATGKQTSWEEDIVLFEQLDWFKVTHLIDPEKLPLTTMDCYVMDVPARYVPIAVAFIKQYQSSKVQLLNLSHLKRVRPLSYHDKSAFSPVSVLLYACSSSPSNLFELIRNHQPFIDLDLNLQVYTLPVPTSVARTDQQAEEWGKVWPVQMMHIREGPKAKPRAQGWERCKMEWIRKEAEKCWQSAKEAKEMGECPIACHVTDTFHPEVHSPTSLPLTLASAHDTRSSTSNPLLHSIPNLIDKVAELDRLDLRPPPLLPSNPPPYLLTGMSLFISHEPCLMCSMALLHSRIANVFYLKASKGSGGCGSVFAVQEGEGLNHRFEVWQWKGGDGLGQGLDVQLDP